MSSLSITLETKTLRLGGRNELGRQELHLFSWYYFLSLDPKEDSSKVDKNSGRNMPLKDRDRQGSGQRAPCDQEGWYDMTEQGSNIGWNDWMDS